MQFEKWYSCHDDWLVLIAHYLIVPNLTRDVNIFSSGVIFFPTPLYGESFFPPVFLYLNNFGTEGRIFSLYFNGK